MANYSFFRYDAKTNVEDFILTMLYLQNISVFVLKKDSKARF